jgi:hypothetical protein
MICISNNFFIVACFIGILATCPAGSKGFGFSKGFGLSIKIVLLKCVIALSKLTCHQGASLPCESVDSALRKGFFFGFPVLVINVP